MIVEKCPSQLDFRALSLGELSEEQSDELLSHLQNCETCQGEVGSSDADDSLVDRLRAGRASMDFSQEAECQQAMAKSLGALSQVDFRAVQETELSEILPDVLGEYEIVRPIGSGGMGAVYLARHSKLGRQVALKVLANHRLTQPKMRRRFESEMRSVGQLSHPNIVTAYDAREFDRIAVLVTEYIDGLDVGKVIRRLGKLPVTDACEIATQIAMALDYVHSQNMVHRDVKPSNVMLAATGNIKLLDLGLARQPVRDDGQPEMTATGQAMGTADYIAPEQITDSRNVDVRADIYSLGCTLFKMLCGRPPFDNSLYPTEFAKMTAHVSVDPPLIAEQLTSVPRELGNLVQRMIAKDVNNRPQTPAEVVDELAKFTSGSDLKRLVDQAIATPEVASSKLHSPAKPLSLVPSQTEPSWFRTSPMFAAIATGLLGIALGIGIGYALGITITVKRPDGTVAKVEVPDGATATVSENGDVAIELASGNISTLGANASQDRIGEVSAAGQNNDDEFPSEIVAENGRILNSNVSWLQGVWRLVGSSDPGAPKLLGFVGGQVVISATSPGEVADVCPVQAKAHDGWLYWNGERYRTDSIDGYSVDISNGKSFQNYERIGLLKQGQKKLFDLELNGAIPLPDRYQSRDMEKELKDFKSDAANAKFWEFVDSLAAKRKVPPKIEEVEFCQPTAIDHLRGVWLVTPIDGTEPDDLQEDREDSLVETEMPQALVFTDHEMIAINRDKSITKLNFEVEESGDSQKILVDEHTPDSEQYSPSVFATFPHYCAVNRFTISRGSANWEVEIVFSSNSTTEVYGISAYVPRKMHPIEDADLKQLKGQGRTLHMVDAFSAIAHYQRTGEFPNGVEAKTSFLSVNQSGQQTYGLTGRVSSASKESLASESELRIYELNRNENHQKLIATTHSASDGSFSFSDLPRFAEDADTKLILACKTDGFATRFVQASFWLRDSKKWELKPESETYNLDVKLSSPAEVTGRVVDENGDPIVNATIHQWVILVKAIDGFGSAKTDSQGRFKITGISGFKPYKVGKNSFVPSTSLFLNHPDFGAYRIRTSKIPNDLNVKIKQPNTVGGQVVDENNNPLKGLPVYSQKQNSNERISTGDLENGQLAPLEWLATKTDEDGKFQFLMPADSKFNLMIENARAVTADMTGRTAAKIDLGQIKSFLPVEVKGIVISHETGEAIEEVVSIGWHGPDRPRSSPGIRTVDTDDKGYFKTEMVAGENFPYICSESKDGMAFETVELRSKAGEVFDAQNPLIVEKGIPVELEIVVRKAGSQRPEF